MLSGIFVFDDLLVVCIEFSPSIFIGRLEAFRMIHPVIFTLNPFKRLSLSTLVYLGRCVARSFSTELVIESQINRTPPLGLYVENVASMKKILLGLASPIRAIAVLAVMIVDGSERSHRGCTTM